MGGGTQVCSPLLPEAGYMMRNRAVQLILRSINSSRSAYASISFINTFFDAYNIFGAAVVQAGVLAKVTSLHLSAHAKLHPASTFICWPPAMQYMVAQNCAN